jgi:PP-loop superfamily ATP-utilizing enzyme
MPSLLTHAERLVSQLRQAGFKYVTLDLAGYRRGSLNEGLIPLLEVTTLS